jgi:Uma2 family endonuclease
MTLTEAQVEAYLHRKKWTREEFAKLGEAFPDQRYELIEGDLIRKSGQSPRHARALMVLTTILSAAFPYRVGNQCPITLPDPEGLRSQPQPDLLVLHSDLRDVSFFPRPKDIAIVIEVSDGTLAIDLDTKARLYSHCGIEEGWVLDLHQQQVTVFRKPGLDKGYELTHVYGADDTISTIDGKLQIEVHHLLA